MTITDIARMANVSVATVSRVINKKSKGVGEETRKKILAIVEEYNFQPSAVARGLVTKKSKIIGLLIQDLLNPYYPRLVKGVEDEANHRGYNVILCDGNNSEEKEINYLDFLNEHYVSGIIYNSFNIVSGRIRKKVVEASIPLVFIDAKVDIPGSRSVYVDNEAAMHEMVSYLIAKGHRRIGFMAGLAESYSTNGRFKGYLKALEEHQIHMDPALIVESQFNIESGVLAMEELLRRNPKGMTAVACCNDLMAIGALEELERKGIKVPEGISVAGFDNIEMSNIVRPRLTTVSQPNYEMGRTSARVLIDTIEGKVQKLEGDFVFSPELVVRDSVATIAGGEDSWTVAAPGAQGVTR
ncbi:LacI family DNA-binding transcriptional regulator [Anaerotalea alkaliphila]|uniref:LacI family transcriptional regulator n=1 Tax=Anaerotalea alkaliphila TaxID=2662126 RepID=A0A7X5HY13_9FIRM|nr:LacI family DNA-binding transcriptional regulator [Anaerotalea alkaliphila]NDL68754.1 LacI family transcriptional regulator [Anaerotalea alkaliphila]